MTLAEALPTVGHAPLAAAVAAFGLTGSLCELPDVPLAPRAWDELLGTVRHERIPGLLAAAVAAGALPVEPEQGAAAGEAAVLSAGSCLLVERRLLAVHERFDQAGIPTRVLKGAAFAHTLYPDPAQRAFGDVDLLVPGDHYDDATAVLAAMGAHRRYPEHRPGFDRRFGKGAAFILPDGYEVDLHRTFVSGPLGLRVDTDGLFRTATPFELGGRTLLGLGLEEQLIHACYHAALGSARPRLTALRDIVQLALHPRLDVHRVRRLAAAWHGEAVVALGVDLAWRTFRLADRTALSVWAPHYEPTPAERRVLSVYVGTSRSYAGQALAGVAALPRPADKLAYARAIALPAGPDRSHLAAMRHHWARGVRAITDALRP